MNLTETLREVIGIEGVTYIGYILREKPLIPYGERLLAVQGQYVRARVKEVTNPNWYNEAYQDYRFGNAPDTYLLRVTEEALPTVLQTFAKNQKIDFLLPDIKVIRPARN